MEGPWEEDGPGHRLPKAQREWNRDNVSYSENFSLNAGN